jgi:hypothetical protein
MSSINLLKFLTRKSSGGHQPKKKKGGKNNLSPRNRKHVKYIYLATVSESTKVLEMGMCSRPTNMAPKRPQNPVIFRHILPVTLVCLYSRRCEPFKSINKVKNSPTTPGEAAGLSILASWPRMDNRAVLFLRALVHNAPCQTSAPNHIHG